MRKPTEAFPEPLEIMISPEMKEVLGALLGTGYFGDSLAAVVERLLGLKLYEMAVYVMKSSVQPEG